MWLNGQTFNFFESVMFLLYCISNGFEKFQVVPEKFHFLERSFLKKSSRYASNEPKKQSNLVVFQDKPLLKNGISQELLGIFQNHLKYNKVKTSQNKKKSDH